MVAYRQLFRNLGSTHAPDSPETLNELRNGLLSFARRLQKRYPFEFVLSKRGVLGERNRKNQEHLVSRFILTALIETSDLSPEQKASALELTDLLIKQIGSGGENFSPKDFSSREKTLSQSVGSVGISKLRIRTAALSEACQMTLGPVNPAEHSVAWSFRYLGQLLKAAEWESVVR